MAMDDSENSLEMSVETPDWLVPYGGRVRLAFTRRWAKRGQQFQATVLEDTGATEGEVGARIDEDEGFAEAYALAAEGAARAGDDTLAAAFAHLVAGAFDSGTRFASEAYLISKLTQLQPIHVRVMDKILHTPPALMESATGSSGLRTTRRAVVLAIEEADRGVVDSAMTDLESLGIATRINPSAPGKAKEVEDWTLTGLGQNLLLHLRLLHPIEAQMLGPRPTREDWEAARARDAQAPETKSDL